MNWTLRPSRCRTLAHTRGRSPRSVATPAKPSGDGGLAERWCGDGCAMGVLLFILHIRYLRFRHGRNDTER